MSEEDAMNAAWGALRAPDRHSPSCSSRFATDGVTGQPICDCGVAFREEDERRFQARKHDGKNPYASKAEAKRIAGMTTSTFGGARKMAYRCPTCGMWHVGTSR